jgi:ABC-type multidrug transport system fused ATPase/permease subunit
MLLGFLDLVGVALIGIIGALSVSGIQSQQPGTRVNEVLTFFHLQHLSFQQQTALLAVNSGIFLIGRTILSVYFSRRILLFISQRSANISTNLISRFLTQDLNRINERTIQETIYSTTTGVNAVTIGVVGVLVTMIADASILLIMSVGLFILDPTVATAAFILFCTVGVILYRTMHLKAKNLGNMEASLNVNSNEKIAEVIVSFRESIVRNSRPFYVSTIGRARTQLAFVNAELNFLPLISKYVIEGSMIVGAILIAGLQFKLQDSRHAVASLAIFMAAGSRIAPAVLRVQQGTVAIRTNLGMSERTLGLIESLPRELISSEIPEYDDLHQGFVPTIRISGLTYRYPSADHAVLKDINLEVAPYTTAAIVGPSGSGKTTLVDLMLGMYSPDHGKLLISEMPPDEAIRKFSGAIGYVPQDVAIVDGTLRENIAMGFLMSEATDARVNYAVQIAQLEELVSTLPEGLDSQVGSRGTKLSGGQRQRLGIARAFFTKPKLLFLDESTSALDSQTELLISNALKEIDYDLTLIIIAHRLSTIQDASQIVYLDAGVIAARGTFDEVRSAVPDFELQAKLMGL